MERTAAEAKAQGYDFGLIQRRIDGKGTVIFTLPGGGSIRDTGREIFYSSHDEKAQEVALQYADKKWGVRKGQILFDREKLIAEEQQKRLER